MGLLVCLDSPRRPLELLAAEEDDEDGPGFGLSFSPPSRPAALALSSSSFFCCLESQCNVEQMRLSDLPCASIIEVLRG
jgi:hypothetical protein